MAALSLHRPVMATVVDWMQDAQLSDVLSWAEEAAQYCERVLIVPKVQGGISRLPRRIGGRDVVLAYSVPTRYGGTELPIWDFAGWPVHLLGGSPHEQMRVWSYLHGIADVVTADGNYTQKMAIKWCQFWVPGNALRAKNRYWPTLQEADGKRFDGDAPYEAFRRSCANVAAAWGSIKTNGGV